MRKAVFIILLVSGLLTVPTGCGVIVRGIVAGYHGIESIFYKGKHGSLTERERAWAVTAWKYFENNRNYSTGLVNATDRYPVAGLNDMAYYLAALVSAYELKVIDKMEFDIRLSGLISFLARMPLFNNQLPNKLYNTQSGAEIDFSGKEAETGWSAVELGHLMIWLKIVREKYPEYGEYIDKTILRWDFCDVIDSTGVLYGSSKVKSKIYKYQEGRLGMEEYAAKGFQAWGFGTRIASMTGPCNKTNLYGIEIPIDARDNRLTGGHNNLDSEPFILDGLEFGWKGSGSSRRMDHIASDKSYREIADKVYKVQELRFRNENIFTARASNHMSTSPYFLYNGVYVDGYPWNTISEDGKYLPQYSLVSTKAVFGFWVLWNTKYSNRLMDLANTLYDSQRGWFEGRFEQGGGYNRSITLSTNAMVLECLYFKQNSTIFRLKSSDTYYNTLLNNEFNRPDKCFPKASVK